VTSVDLDCVDLLIDISGFAGGSDDFASYGFFYVLFVEFCFRCWDGIGSANKSFRGSTL
jgi:hypothetical protein